jgi:hypothetical protein
VETSQAKTVLEIDDPHFALRLYENRLEIDLKGNTRKEIVEAFENKSALRRSIGNILDIFAPLHIHLSQIDSVQIDSHGNVKLVLPWRRDVTLPLDPNKAKTFADTLNPLIAKEKEKEARRAKQERRAEVARTRGYIAILAVGVTLAGIFGYLLGHAH